MNKYPVEQNQGSFFVLVLNNKRKQHILSSFEKLQHNKFSNRQSIAHTQYTLIIENIGHSVNIQYKCQIHAEIGKVWCQKHNSRLNNLNNVMQQMSCDCVLSMQPQ